MTRTLRTAFGLAAMSLAMGTQAQEAGFRTLDMPAAEIKDGKSATPIQRKGNAIWSEDFGNGFPAGWTITDNSGICPWTWSLDGSWGFFNGNQGTSGTDPIESTTAANGFLIADNDSANNVTYGQPSGTTYQYLATYFTTNAIDLTGFPNVQLEFEQYFRYNNSPVLSVEVSNDGTTWTQWDVKGSVQPNTASTNPDLVSLNISAVAGNQPTVYIRIGWDSRVYYWMIDDMRIVPTAQYEGVCDFGVISHTGGGEEYGRVPTDQFQPTLNLGAQVRNAGFDTLTNVTVDVQVLDPMSATFITTTLPVGTLNPGDTVYVDADPALPAVMMGTYTATFTMNSDQNASEPDLTNNEVERAFAVDDMLYSLDGVDVHLGTETLLALGTGNFTGNTDGVYCFTYFQIEQTTTVYGLDVLLSNNSEADGIVIGSIHDTLTVLADDPSQPLIESLDVVLTAADITNGQVTIPFAQPQVLTPGGYYAAVSLFSNGGTSDIFVIDDNTVPQPGNAGLMYLPSVATPGVYGNGNAFAIRLNLDQTIGIAEDEEVPGFGVYPNPTLDGRFTVTTSGTGTYDLIVVNTLGEQVATARFNGNTLVDLKGLAAGVYTVRVSDGTRTSVRRVTRQ
ncbi:MAG: T9SS type A sorting domain-containing protein [Flavobacteriales bacterium]|nr:T9SS type A sorting domain-containing protein [Flavobacteriales bacterium]